VPVATFMHQAAALASGHTRFAMVQGPHDHSMTSTTAQQLTSKMPPKQCSPNAWVHWQCSCSCTAQ